MQVVLALVLVAFIGLNANPKGDRSQTRATVNGVRILDTQYVRALRDTLRRIEMQSGRTLSDAEQRQVGEDVRQRLIEEEVLRQEAQRLGLQVSDSEVARQLLDLTFLRDDKGHFDPDLYQRFLKRQGMAKADFEETVRDEILRQKLQQLVFLGASMSEPALREAYVDRETRVDLNIVRIRPAAFETDVAVSDEDRAAWLTENAALVEETYKRDFERLYNHPEQVRLSLIRLAVVSGGENASDLLPKLNQVRDQAAGGAKFEDLARRWSEDPSALEGGNLGLRPVAQLSSEMSEAVAGLEPGALTRVFATDTDVRFLRVEERVPPKVDSLDDVKASIADAMMRDERVPALAASFAQELLLKWKQAGTVPQDLLAAHGLAARDTGPIPTKGGQGMFAPPASLLDDARRAAVGDVLPEVYEEGGVLFVAQLTARTDPDMSSYESSKSEIREQILLDRRMSFYQDWVSWLKSQAKIE